MMISPDHWRTFLKPRMAALHRRNQGDQSAAEGRLPLRRRPAGDHSGIDRDRRGRPQSDPAGLHGPGRNQAALRRSALLLGELDEQRTLPFGTPEDVRREVRTRLETIGRGGGLILGPTHHVQLDTPLENFWAMVETIRGGK